MTLDNGSVHSAERRLHIRSSITYRRVSFVTFFVRPSSEMPTSDSVERKRHVEAVLVEVVPGKGLIDIDTWCKGADRTGRLFQDPEGKNEEGQLIQGEES